MKATTVAHAYVYAHIFIYACASVWVYFPVGDRVIRCLTHVGLMVSVLHFGSMLGALKDVAERLASRKIHKMTKHMIYKKFEITSLHTSRDLTI